ncbi:tRNA(Phe) (4-demethylwyosine(37)-C(7)) aminocarboxypropyltransferase [Starmerella bacillaris]|uniref:tRNA wybutosine-synthesizing protein 2 n=1 Tax=Starmerella bacillaris TaxID=1247836 RepID=A0AAV5RNG5_STABA|nr:tRNA(Phe) (4-demethylwyosine(37)-C(7)) aminocarboxypropyltransferase [Starmerella bacillaris]
MDIHFIFDAQDLKSTVSTLNTANIPFKLVKKPNGVHVFIAKNEECETLVERYCKMWVPCSGCDSCSGTKSKKAIKYVLYPPMILFPTGTQLTDELKNQAQELLAETKTKGCTHAAINAPIQASDVIRKPQIVPVIGDFGEFYDYDVSIGSEEMQRSFWATSLQNQIFQTWAPMYTMFSRGNITEKKRVLTQFNQQSTIENSTVIDLYAGIGYFTLPYAKQRPKQVYCWEINPWSVEGLARAAKKNGFRVQVVQTTEKYTNKYSKDEPQTTLVVFMEDNIKARTRIDSLDLERVSHINMGLLPHAREAFETARALSTPGTVFHVHENVRKVELSQWKKEVGSYFGECLHLEEIKDYSPGVKHVCGDFKRN